MQPGPAPLIESITFDFSGWHEHEREQERTVWGNAGNVLSIDDARQIAKPGGIVAIDSYSVGFLARYPDHLQVQVRLGIDAQRDSHWGVRGVRVPTNRALPRRELPASLRPADAETIGGGEDFKIRKHPMRLRPFNRSSGYLEGWVQDPYDPRYRGVALRSIADNEEYDAQFPDHPLSRLRSTLSDLSG